MAVLIELPAPPQGVYSWRIPYRLDRVSGSIHMIWNPIHQSWVLYFLDGAGDLMAGPQAAVPPSDLFAQWRHLDLPPGTLTVVGPVERPGALDWGTRCRLVYTSVAES